MDCRKVRFRSILRELSERRCRVLPVWAIAARFVRCACANLVFWQTACEKVPQLVCVDKLSDSVCGLDLENKSAREYTRYIRRTSLSSLVSSNIASFKISSSNCFLSSTFSCSTKGLRSLYAVLAFPYFCKYLIITGILSWGWPWNGELLTKVILTKASEAFRFQLLSISQAGSKWASTSAITASLGLQLCY